MALRVIESIERTPRSPPEPTRWHEARALEFGRDGAGHREPEERGHGWACETRCSGISAGQSVVLNCGFDMPIADFLAGLDR